MSDTWSAIVYLWNSGCLLPILIIAAFGAFLFVPMVETWSDNTSRAIGRALRDNLDLPSNRAVVVQKTKMISLDEITEKPKRGLVTLGDDGELTSILEESELETYHIIR